jgi:hypothetical protein
LPNKSKYSRLSFDRYSSSSSSSNRDGRPDSPEPLNSRDEDDPNDDFFGVDT